MSQITADQFISSCSQFISLSDTAGDNWIVVGDGGHVWIHRDTVQTITKHGTGTSEEGLSDLTHENHVVDDALKVENTLETTVDDDNTINTKTPNTEQISCSYEVHYSPSYSVPVLYCRFWNCSGQLLGLEQVWSLAPLPARGWDRVSMAPHPVTGMPWVQVHPCKTGQVTSLMRRSSDSRKCNYIVTFLSLYGQAVGLHMSTEYAANRL